MKKRKLSRRQLRSLLLHEVRVITSKKRNSKKPLNESILLGIVGALGVLAFGAMYGFLYHARYERFLEEKIRTDPEVQQLMAELGAKVKRNPNMSPVEVAAAAADQDARLAARLEQLAREVQMELIEIDNQYDMDKPIM